MMQTSKANILSNTPNALPEEVFDTLLQAENLKIERIISKGQCSEDGFWYDQAQAEWVLLLKGAAELEFEDGKVQLSAGDYVNITAHQKHRVSWTTPDEETIWLAIFYNEAASE